MKRGVYIFLTVTLLLGLYFLLQPADQDTERVPHQPLTNTAENTAVARDAVVVPPDTPPDPRLNRLSDGRTEFKPALNASRQIQTTQSPQDNLAEIETILGHYRFAYGENPVGVENFEFTEQLLGQNPKKIVFIAADSPALKGNELVDQWGTPYFFHPLSGQEMELRAAGPDRTFWTQDDISNRKSENPQN